ncbi:uncharacterized protein K452DRAFT_335339 [Aplosporella prunicola CBS 121167]|uniref:Uncharacterized protein n=1 Tax=Aplosporella prunicola CBS 121167 TaxID=1176127 RepID=A0A6A6B8L2_9PEZI|nr:uncharacterized protein K452DRAFT_335339 [Aplosporella prunicola CBS 121167]KAF2140276.1 hypothetical protein K452DRAFT_335339 [Aplosporella prunicola CBS 121167]
MDDYDIPIFLLLFLLSELTTCYLLPYLRTQLRRPPAPSAPPHQRQQPHPHQQPPLHPRLNQRLLDPIINRPNIPFLHNLWTAEEALEIRLLATERLAAFNIVFAPEADMPLLWDEELYGDLGEEWERPGWAFGLLDPALLRGGMYRRRAAYAPRYYPALARQPPPPPPPPMPGVANDLARDREIGEWSLP